MATRLLACADLHGFRDVYRWLVELALTGTIIVGRDAEIVFQRPPHLASLPLTFSHIVNGPKMLARLALHMGDVTRAVLK